MAPPRCPLFSSKMQFVTWTRGLAQFGCRQALILMPPPRTELLFSLPLRRKRTPSNETSREPLLPLRFGFTKTADRSTQPEIVKASILVLLPLDKGCHYKNRNRLYLMISAAFLLPSIAHLSVVAFFPLPLKVKFKVLRRIVRVSSSVVALMKIDP